MAKNEQMLRLMYIFKYLQSNKQGADYLEISKFLEERFSNDYQELSFAPKTFQRDRKTLNELFNIEIEYKNSDKKYHLINDDFSDIADSIFENLILVNAYRKSKENEDLIVFEKRQASGFYNLETAIQASKNKKIISFSYTKHWETTAEKRVIEPYALKEFRNRWYLIGNEFGSGNFKLKTFGLDRITDLEILYRSFHKLEIDIDKFFSNAFGIIISDNAKPEKIILSFNPRQAKFVKSLPLHHSQEIIIDNEEEFQISLQLIPTYDFYQELLTHAERLTIVSPEKVKDEYLRFVNKAIELNKK
jgi:predicted DNA-binding transcriptional regulator YafY